MQLACSPFLDVYNSVYDDIDGSIYIKLFSSLSRIRVTFYKYSLHKFRETIVHTKYQLI